MVANLFNHLTALLGRLFKIKLLLSKGFIPNYQYLTWSLNIHKKLYITLYILNCYLNSSDIARVTRVKPTNRLIWFLWNSRRSGNGISKSRFWKSWLRTASEDSDFIIFCWKIDSSLSLSKEKCRMKTCICLLTKVLLL